MPTFDEARQIVLDAAERLVAEPVPLLEAGGRVLAQDVLAPWDMPQWDNSAMDGYAVRAADCAAGLELPVVAFLPAGQAPTDALAPGTAIKIMTGAPLPAGADAVVPIEDAEDRGATVVVRIAPGVGDHVRLRAGDIHAGERVLDAGSLLSAAEVALLASFGQATIPAVRRPRVALLSTGDELLEPGEPLTPGRIYNSNSAALAAATLRAGAVPIVLPVARDTHDALRTQLVEGLTADVLVTTAGVSMGDRDLVREGLRELGVQEAFWKVDIQPGRPTAFGRLGPTPVFSLPGNPVAAMLTFELFVRPVLRKLQGHRDPVETPLRAQLGEDVRPRSDRVTLRRVRIERHHGELVATSSGKQATGFVRTMTGADGVAIIPTGDAVLEQGREVDVYPLRDELRFHEG